MYNGIKVLALIPAAGSGRRMGLEKKKQFLRLEGKEILEWTMMNMLQSNLIDEVYIVVSREDVDNAKHKIKTWIQSYKYELPIQVICGGDTRQESIFNGLRAMGETDAYVLIHDGVRPFFDVKTLDLYFSGLSDCAGVIAAVPITDTLKEVNSKQEVLKTIDREKIWAVQTPQVFLKNILMDAHQSALHEGILVTDDASLLEHYGYKVKIEPSNRDNIKITTPFDLVVAKSIILNRSKI